MPGIVLIGTQWGDEGKGKFTHLMADGTDMVVRYSGGNNAGHTVMVGTETFKLHLVPVGILYPNIIPVMASGVVIDPAVLIEELDGLEARGVTTKNLLISLNAHLIMPYHKELDRLSERRLGKMAIGTSKRGIGPAYADKATRVGLRVQDLLDPKIFRTKLDHALKEKNQILTKIYGRLPMDFEEMASVYLSHAERLEPHITDTVTVVQDALAQGKTVLFEGAHGTLLDIDHGTYPFVTSTGVVAGAVCSGAGVGPRAIDRIIGITKAFTTRVGEGPFPTEEHGDVGDILREFARGREYGTTTGRPRRCGWFDAVVVRYTSRLSSLDEIFLTKLDTMSSFKELKICVAYEFDGKRYEEFPHQSVFHKATPVYESIAGWNSDISEVRRWEDLPGNARAYVERIEKLVGVPITQISVGPEATETISRKFDSRVAEPA